MPPDRQQYQRAAALLWRRCPDRVLVCPPVQGVVVTALAGTALAVWDSLTSPLSVEELARELSSSYEAPAGQIVEDLNSLLPELTSLGLIEVVHGC